MYVDLRFILSKIPYSKASIYRLMDENRFPRQLRFEGKALWRRTDFEAWLKKYDPEFSNFDAELEDLLS